MGFEVIEVKAFAEVFICFSRARYCQIDLEQQIIEGWQR